MGRLLETPVAFPYLPPFPVRKTANDHNLLLYMSPMEREASKNASEHYDFIFFFLSVYRKSISKMVLLVGDNANINRGMFRLVELLFVRCHSHLFNLAVKSFI